MLKHCVIHGKNVAYFDSGVEANQRGTLVFLHGSSGSHRMFSPFVESLAERYRILAPDFLGYGSSESWPENQPYHWQYDVDIVLHLAQLAHGPVHCVAYSFGAFLALEAALQASDGFLSLVLAEPAALHLLQDHRDASLWQSIRKVGQSCAEAAANGDNRRAASIYMKYWGSSLQWLLTPKKLKMHIQSKIHKVAKEFLAQEADASTLSAYAAIHQPTLLLVGDKTRGASKAIVQLFGDTLRNSHTAWLPDANHLTLLKKTDEVAAALDTWLRSRSSPDVAPVPIDTSQPAAI